MMINKQLHNVVQTQNILIFKCGEKALFRAEPIKNTECENYNPSPDRAVGTDGSFSTCLLNRKKTYGPILMKHGGFMQHSFLNNAYIKAYLVPF